MYNEVDGDLIQLAKDGKFDVITHGCNCQSAMKSGIAVQMDLHFGCSKFPMELLGPNILKLGSIDYKEMNYLSKPSKSFIVVNSYTQIFPSIKAKPFDYEAFTVCMRKMNSVFAGKHIGMPRIGAGLAGGDWEKIKKIIQRESRNIDVTVVNYNK